MHLWVLLKWIVLLICSSLAICLFFQGNFAMTIQKTGLLHPTKNVGFAMTKLLIKEIRKFLRRWLIARVVRLENENNQYKIEIKHKNEKNGSKNKN
jgi:hypothetical protein